MMRIMRTETTSRSLTDGRARRLAAAALAAVLQVAASGPAAAGDTNEAGSDMGVGLGAVGANLFYIPVKVCYSLLGGVTGGLAWALTGGNQDVADRIWVPSMGGDYVVTPDHISGERRIYFSGLRRGGDRSSSGAARTPAASTKAASAEGSEPGAADGFGATRERATF